MTNQTEHLDERTRHMLQECRTLATKRLPPLKDSIEELRTQSISSPNLDGMPHGSSNGDASANRLIRLEKREREYERELARLERLRKACRRAIRPLELRRRIFYESYYIEAEKASRARAEAGIAERTATKYIADIRAKKETGE